MQSWNGSSSSVRRWLGLTAIAVIAVTGSVGDVGAETMEAPSTPTSFAELLAGFVGTTGFEARFEEEKYLALVAAPLRSSGRLYFTPPSTMLRRVEKPRRKDILVARDQVRISDDAGTQTIDLAGRAEVRPLVESMIWIFTGDLESLEATYRVDYQVLERVDGEQRRWVVRLIPLRPPLSQLVRELRVHGSGRTADLLELEETSGDRTVTRIVDVDRQRRSDSEDRRDPSGVPSP
jgi:hypothetical protein